MGTPGDRLARLAVVTLLELADELSGYWLHVSIDETGAEETMAATTAELLRSYVRKLRRRLQRIESADDLDAIHAARIAAKALRYLLNALGDFAAASATATQLSELQDTLPGSSTISRRWSDRVLEEIATIAAKEARWRTSQASGSPTSTRRAGPGSHQAWTVGSRDARAAEVDVHSSVAGTGPMRSSTPSRQPWTIGGDDTGSESDPHDDDLLWG